MIRMRLLATFSLALLVTLDVHAQAPIWSADHWAENSGTLPGGSWQIAFVNVSGGSSESTIFSMSLVTNDTGRTFFANTVNESDFGGFVANLTDGVNGVFRFQQGSPGSFQDWSEQGYLGRSSLAPDLAGYNITQIGFRVNNFYDYFDVPEDRYFRHLDYSLDFYGVPEPSVCSLLGLGGAAAWLMRRKASKVMTGSQK
jgi:hypothetical protein